VAWEVARRTGLVLAGVVLILAGAWVSLLAFLYAAVAFREPNPDPSLDGDPCCDHPDTWTDVAVGSVYFAATAVAALGLIGCGLMLWWAAQRGSVPPQLRRSKALRRAGVVALVCGVGVPASWLVWGLIENRGF